MRLAKRPEAIYTVRITSPDLTADVGCDLFVSEQKALARYAQLTRASSASESHVQVVMEVWRPSPFLYVGGKGLVKRIDTALPVKEIIRRTH